MMARRHCCARVLLAGRHAFGTGQLVFLSASGPAAPEVAWLTARLPPFYCGAQDPGADDIGQLDAVVLRPDTAEPMTHVAAQHERVGCRFTVLLLVSHERD